MFSSIYSGKTVIVTGNTGFKGSWLSIWLKKLGANVIGYSDCIPTVPSLFEAAQLNTSITQVFGDIRDFESFSKLVEYTQPDFLFHLAAQPIVSTSYTDPINTISTNVIGTSVVLNCLRMLEKECVAVIITSDKCYNNKEWPWGYRETDELGGKDIYSGSKAAAENIFNSFYQSYFNKPQSNIKLSSVRAGNVIGGGDWAQDRIVVDCVNNWKDGKFVNLRSPHATRPWQHVLEPLSGYLNLAMCLKQGKDYSGMSFNFGPKSNENNTVLDLIKKLHDCLYLPQSPDKFHEIIPSGTFNECSLLKLDCERARILMNWSSTLDFEECVDFVGKWYSNFYLGKVNNYEFTSNQIDQYCDFALSRNLDWTRK